MTFLSLRLQSIRYEADGICSLELQPIDGGLLPAFGAGAHIDVYLANGLVRSYSLCNSQEERHRYVVGVQLDPASRGGSAYIHAQLRVGEHIKVSAPRNNFCLEESAQHTVLVAGGIGITPLWSMLQRLETLRRSWELHYAVRSRRAAAFLAQIQTLDAAAPGKRVFLHFDDEAEGFIDLRRIASSAAEGSHFYCCGPTPMLKAYQDAMRLRPPSLVHLEHFTPQQEPSLDGGFQVVLQRSGKTLTVVQGKTILDAVLEAGVDVPYSCLAGVCSSCETRVLDGEPDHRDAVLSQAERDSNKVMMVCCSGAKSSKLVLDL